MSLYMPLTKKVSSSSSSSSAQFSGSSRNEVLLVGPDLTNSLLGILLRFRQEPVAVVADVQQMFYCFYVNREHRNYLRFL